MNSAIIVRQVWDDRLSRFRNIHETDIALYETLVAYQHHREQKWLDQANSQSNSRSNGQRCTRLEKPVIIMQLSSPTKCQVHCSTGLVLGSIFQRHLLTVSAKYVGGKISKLEQADYAKLCNDVNYAVVHTVANSHSVNGIINNNDSDDKYTIHMNIVTRHWHQAVAHFETDTMSMTVLMPIDIAVCNSLHYSFDHSFMNTPGITYHCRVTQHLEGINYDGYDSDPYDEVEVSTSNQLNVFMFAAYATAPPTDLKSYLIEKLLVLSPHSESTGTPTVVNDTRPSHPRDISRFHYTLNSYSVINPTGPRIDQAQLAGLTNIIQLNL